MSPTNPPGTGPQQPGDWRRRPRSAVRRPTRREPGGRDPAPDGRGEVADWSGRPAHWQPDSGFDPRPAAGRPDPRWDPGLEPPVSRGPGGGFPGAGRSARSGEPSWLGQRGEALAPIRRLRSISVAFLAILLTLALIAGAHTTPESFAVILFGVQVLFVAAWTVATRPAGAPVVVGVGVLAAGGADLAAVWPHPPSLAPLGYVTAGAFVLGVIGQLARGGRRSKATESLGATLTVVIGTVGYACLIVLSRLSLGPEALTVCLVGAGVSLVVARLLDVVLPVPRTSPQVPRGGIGVVLGPMAGTLAAALAGSLLIGMTPAHSAIAGLVTSMAAIMADLAASYAEAGRQLAGAPPALWAMRHMQGPLAAMALSAPAAFLLSAVLLVPGLG